VTIPSTEKKEVMTTTLEERIARLRSHHLALAPFATFTPGETAKCQ
jgi:hypothetical protein